MASRKVPAPDGTLIPRGQRILVPVATGTGNQDACVSVQLAELPQLVSGLRVTVALSIPAGSLIAVLDLPAVETLEDQLAEARAALEAAQAPSGTWEPRRG